MRSRLATAVICLPLVASPAGAQDQPRKAPPPVLTDVIRPGSGLEDVKRDALRSFRNLDANADGKLDATDSALHVSIAAAAAVALAVGDHARSDLDGDGVVTEAEARARARYSVRENADTQLVSGRIDALVKEAMARDADGDGRVTLTEVVASAKTKLPRSGYDLNIGDVLGYVGNAEGAVGRDEYLDIEARIFAEVDGDNNGTISKDEYAAAQRIWSERRSAVVAMPGEQAGNASACMFPPATTGAKVLLLSAYEADALSTTAIGSQDDAVGTATVTVEPGEQPVYLVLASTRATIWRFSGAVERLERVVLAAQKTQGPVAKKGAVPLIGATGLPADRITFLRRSDCLKPFTEVPSTEAALANATVRAALGRETVIAARRQVSGFSVPSATVRATDRPNLPMVVIEKPGGTIVIEGKASVVIDAGSGDLASEIARYHPGGVVDIDPATVVSTFPAVRYDVLPDQAGLLQLVQRGALEKSSTGQFLIRQKLRFPAGLYGAHAEKFLLMRGVPAPEGDPGQSCVISEETGEILANSPRCR